MLIAVLLLLANPDLDACKANVASHCQEVCSETGARDEHGAARCVPEVYDRCVERGEKICREKFPGGD